MPKMKKKKTRSSEERKKMRRIREIKRDAEGQKKIDEVTDAKPPRSVHDLVFAFQEALAVTEARGTAHQIRNFLETEYEKVFQEDADKVAEVTDKTLKGVIAYWYQVEGYRESGLKVPAIVLERQANINRRKEEEIMKKQRSKTADKEKQTRPRDGKTASVKGTRMRGGVAPRLRELLMENRKEKRTDEQIEAILDKEFPGRAHTDVTANWMRNDLKRRATDSDHRSAGSVPWSLAQIEKECRRYDTDGKDITGQVSRGRKTAKPAKAAKKAAEKTEKPAAKKAVKKAASKKAPAAKPAAKPAKKTAAKVAEPAAKKAPVKKATAKKAIKKASRKGK